MSSGYGKGIVEKRAPPKPDAPSFTPDMVPTPTPFFFFFVDQLEGAPVGLLAPHISVFSLEVALYFLCNIC